MLPLITVRGTQFYWNLELGWNKLLEAFIYPEKLAASAQVIPPYMAWLMVAPAGMGKTRFAVELAKVISEYEHLGCQVVLVPLRNLSAFLELCEVKPEKLDTYVQHFAKNWNFSALTDKKLIFIFDEYEQVCKLYATVLEKLFKKISLDRHPMLITTRPNSETEATMTQVCYS